MKKNCIGILLIVLVFGIVLIGCDMEPEIPTYTIYIKTFNFSSSDPVFGTLQNGYYRSFEITQTDFNWEKSNNFQNVSPNIWTEDQIISTLVGWGFSNTQAKQEASKFISFNHFMLGDRDGSSLRIMMK